MSSLVSRTRRLALTALAIDVRQIALPTAVGMAILLPLPASSMSGPGYSGAAAAAICHGRVATIVGTGGADELRGTPEDDVIAARGGNDRVWGFGGNDVLCGGKGHDAVAGGGGDDMLNGGSASDHLVGGPGRNNIVGGGAPPFTWPGTWDPDHVGYGWSPSSLRIDLRSGVAQTAQSHDVVRGVAWVVGSHFADRIVGSDETYSILGGGPGYDVIVSGAKGASMVGGGGGDIVRGSDLPDLLIGRTGDDRMVGRLGRDFYLGGKGADTALDAGGSTSVVDYVGANVIRTAAGIDEIEAVGAISVGRGDDAVFTMGGSVAAGPGQDKISPVARDDGSMRDLEISAGSGSDTVYVSSPVVPDQLSIVGGAGDDWLHIAAEYSSGVTFEMSMGASGTFAQPFTGSFADVENYVCEGGDANHLITGSDGPDNVDLNCGTSNRIWGLGGDDLLADSTGRSPASIDGGDGFDRCSDYANQLNCEDEAP